MSEAPKSNLTPDDAARLERIESALAHLQHDVDTMNASLLDFLQRFQAFDARCQRLEANLQQAMEHSEPSDPEQELPPHY